MSQTPKYQKTIKEAKKKSLPQAKVSSPGGNFKFRRKFQVQEEVRVGAGAAAMELVAAAVAALALVLREGDPDGGLCRSSQKQ